MAAQAGKDILLKIEDPASQAFATVAGLRTKRVSFNAQSVDITDADSAGQWRELLAGAGVRRASISGSGIFKDQTSDGIVRGAFFEGAMPRWQVIIPDFGTLEGSFAIAALDYAGNHDSEVTFEIALESAAELTFIAH